MRVAQILAIAGLTGIALQTVARADEGMWTYDNFPAAAMRAKYGWAPDQAWLDHARLSSIRLAQGCSASLVSANGLVMTNHHCARSCIGALSDAKHDYIADGFYAPTLAEEKPCPELEANQLTAITDVTKTIQAATAGLSGKAFADAERAVMAKTEKACSTAADLRCQVVTLYHGGVYDLYTYRRYQDLRLVWAVEDSAANFGGDPDNFNYPRYAIDSAFVRIYDHGKPLHADNFLRFSKDGVAAGGITLTSGNPGRTDRDDTVAQLQFQRDTVLPFLISWFSEMRGMLHEMGTKGAEQARISLTDLFFDENSLKAFKGQEKALVEGSLIADKTKAEAALRQRVAADPSLAPTTSGAWDAIADAITHEKPLFFSYLFLETAPSRLAANTLRLAIELNRYAAESGKPDGERLTEYSDSNFPALKQDILSPAPIFPELEKTNLAFWATKLRENLGADDANVHTVLGRASPDELAANLIGGTRLADPKFRAKLFAGGAAAINASDDPMLVFARRLDGPARLVRADFENNVKAVITKNTTLIAKAKFALEGTSAYPDATFTLRLSYGTAAGYEQDGKSIPPFTTFSGAFARETGSDPFKLPPTWTRAKSSLDLNSPLDMASTNDIIGGNSGSPVIDRNGDAVGLIFDGNIQSLGGDFGYDGSVNRAVSVDTVAIREALTKIYHADRIVKELAQ